MNLQKERPGSMDPDSRQGLVWYLLNMHGAAMLPEEVQSSAAGQHRGGGAIVFTDFSIVGTISGYRRSRPRRFLSGLELVARRLARPQASLPERLWITARDRRYEFRAIQHSKGADVEFGLALLALAGYEIQVAGGPFGGGFHWIYSGYQANDMGAHFWGGGFLPEASKIALATNAYAHRDELSEDLRRAIEINHFAIFAPNEETRMSLCVSALERLAGFPPLLLRKILPRTQERKELTNSLAARMQEAGLDPTTVSRLRDRISQTQAHNTATQVKEFCRGLGVFMSDEHWAEAFKTRNTIGHVEHPNLLRHAASMTIGEYGMRYGKS